jgi:hypothetical protein
MIWHIIYNFISCDSLRYNHSSRILCTIDRSFARSINSLELSISYKFTRLFLQVDDLPWLFQAHSTSTWAHGSCLNTLPLLKCDFLNLTGVKQGWINCLLVRIIWKHCAWLILACSRQLILSIDKFFFILSNNLSICLVAFQCIRLILNHLSQMCLFSD